MVFLEMYAYLLLGRRKRSSSSNLTLKFLFQLETTGTNIALKIYARKKKFHNNWNCVKPAFKHLKSKGKKKE